MLLIKFITSLSRGRKRKLIICSDSIILCFVFFFSFYLINPSAINEPNFVFIGLPVVFLIYLIVFQAFGLYSSIIRFMNIEAIGNIFKATIVSFLLFWCFIFFYSGKFLFYESILFLFSSITLLTTNRMIAKWILYKYGQNKDTSDPVLIYGAGAAGTQLSMALSYSEELEPVGFIDDDKSLHGSEINSLKVYDPEKIDQVCIELGIETVLLALPSATRKRKSQIFTNLQQSSLQIRTLPGISELAQGKIRVEDIRKIEIQDLLGRVTVPPDKELIRRNVVDKSILVTGAGGSIGSELCRQIISLNPKRLVLFEQNEYSLYLVFEELKKSKYKVEQIIPVLGNILNQNFLTSVLHKYEINTVYHSAAYKHVDLVEKNIIPAVENNILGTYSCIQSALSSSVEDFVFISTDKAVRPTSLMGATKRVAEIILQAKADEVSNLAKGKEKVLKSISLVRFGNVLNSSGSVVPIFREQILKGGPVTVTHSEVTRYFMTIPEAAQLVIQAGAMGKKADIFILDMGEPVRIIDLAKHMIYLSGLELKDEKNPDGDIEISITGLKPGEKMYEELLIDKEKVNKTNHPLIMTVREEAHDIHQIEIFLEKINKSISLDKNSRKIRSLIEELVPELKDEEK